MRKSFVCFDIGSDSLKMAVMSADEQGPPQLDDYAVVSLDVPRETALGERNRIVAQTIRFMLDERKLKPKTVFLSLSGQSVFVRFVKLPAVEESKIAQIVRYEAQQQVPFPIEEVEWDHQVIGDASGDEIDIVLVAIKTEIVSGLVEAIRRQHIDVEVVDIASLALYNAMIYNEGPFETTAALVDMGAKTTSLIIAEGINLWSRTIPIGGDNVTEAIAKELEVSTEEAGKLQRLARVGQAAEGPETGGDEQVRRASEAVTKVLNRLLAEIRRSIGYHRTQSQGSPVQRVLLSGGVSFIKGVGTFLSDKLHVDVAPLSPLAKVNVSPSVDAEALKVQRSLLGDVIGVGLRAAGRGIIETNLLPKAIAYQRELSKKKVFIAGAAACLIGAVALLGIKARSDTQSAKANLSDLERRCDSWSGLAQDIRREQSKLNTIEGRLDEIRKIRDARLFLVDFIETIKRDKPDYAWLTRVELGGPGAMSASGYGYGGAYGSPPGASYGGTSRMTTGRSLRGGGRVTRPTGSSEGSTTRRTSDQMVLLEGYLKITRSGPDPELVLASQVEDLRLKLEENKYFSDVRPIKHQPIEGSEKYKEKLVSFVFEAGLDIKLDF
jgi:type IV pilus assembly protein PilM